MNRRLCIALLILLPLLQAATFAQTPLSQVWPPPDPWLWATEPWTNSDQPYRQWRDDVSKKLSARQLSDATLKTLRAASQRQPQNALLRFKWANYAFAMALLEPDVSQGSGKLYGVREAFENWPSPRVYEYTRMRFLVWSYLVGSEQRMARLGERLLKRNSKDFLVKYYTVIAVRNGTDADQKRALRYARELVRDFPENVSAYNLVGTTYRQMWWRHKRPSDARLAAQYFRLYLKKASPKGKERSQIEHRLKELDEASR